MATGTQLTKNPEGQCDHPQSINKCCLWYTRLSPVYYQQIISAYATVTAPGLVPTGNIHRVMGP